MKAWHTANSRIGAIVPRKPGTRSRDVLAKILSRKSATRQTDVLGQLCHINLAPGTDTF